ncbi:uncharacterized protein LOC125661778 isoform X5 [Ostrea edulis]|uniref:uncharacterized protein LOC130048105 isoform X6 n=1 Tax=Ostrea edulis TaxID=37623 RepID=UPI0024AFA284|nr:uncharacterized protein LOC130048105 isoform X6 [Ostrea edulis]XP_056015829.1 uncharacterized protein LOC125661778 isoform X5 [Ostrea edulis]
MLGQITIRASSIHTTWMPTKDDNENDIDMIEVEKDCDYFSMKKDLSTNDAERKRNKKDSCTLQFTKKPRKGLLDEESE